MKQKFQTNPEPVKPKVQYRELQAPTNVQFKAKVNTNGNSNTNLGN